MSGAEAVTVVGVISSIITIVEHIKRVHDALANQQGLPATFREVAGRLPIVRDTLELARQHIDDGRADDAGVMQVVKACQSKTRNLDNLFQKTILGDRASFRERYWKALKVLGKGNKVEDLMKGILVDVQLLACEHGMRVATPSQQTQISEAITDVSALPSSAPDDVFQDSGFAANSFGSGAQANAPWGNIAPGFNIAPLGNIAPRGNIVQDTAKLYNSGGGSMYIGKD